MVPVLHFFFAQLPAELNEFAVAIRRKVDQAFERSLQLDAHSVEARDRFEQLELRAASRIARLLMPVAIFLAGAGTFRLVLCDPRYDPPHARQLVVRLFDGIGTEPLHRSTI